MKSENTTLKISENLDEVCTEGALLMLIILLQDENSAKCCDRSGVKGCESDKSRQAFSNQHLAPKIGVETVESEPTKSS